MPATDRKEIRVPGMPEPVSHYTDVAGRGEPKASRAHRGVQWKSPARVWVRGEYLGASRPASTLVEISRLVRDDLLLEIEAVAELPE